MRSITLLVPALILGSFSGPTRGQEDGRTVIQEAKDLERAGRDDEARALLDRFVTERPDDPWVPAAHLKLAFLCRKSRRFEEQLANAEAVLAKDTAGQFTETAELMKGFALVSLGRDLEARALIEKLASGSEDPLVRQRAEERWRTVQKVGEPAPALAVDRWLAGPVEDLASLKGKVVLLDFFQEGCSGCAAAESKIRDLQEKFRGKGLHTIGIGVRFENAGPDAIEGIARWMAGTRRAHDSLAVDANASDTFQRYAAEGTPFCAVIDREGRLVHLDFFDPDTVPALVERLVGEDGGEGE
ncbi:MAG: redoxin family protein [Planctomycetes bacterium]|nr:redoxin family protein [Planctomycetota bacterium]